MGASSGRQADGCRRGAARAEALAVADGGRRLTLAVVLGGHYAGRDAVRLLGDTRGVVVAAVSYPCAGDPRPDAATFLRDIPKIRAAFLDTPPARVVAAAIARRRPDAAAAGTRRSRSGCRDRRSLVLGNPSAEGHAPAV